MFKLSGKLQYFNYFFPYIVLLILGIRGWTLEGSEMGIQHLIAVDHQKLKDISIWKDAAGK
jgi:solute carrier family 6 amino acid transporter-like protein 5/7/9/14